MLTHDEVNTRFLRLDHNSVILEAAFRGWWAWPIVKERLWLYCLNNQVISHKDRKKPSCKVFRRLSSGFWQIFVNLLFNFEVSGALFYEGRSVCLPDGRKLHPHLGSLERIERTGTWLHYRFPWVKVGKWFPGPGEIEDYGISSVFAALANVLRFRNEEKKVGRIICNELLKEFPFLDAEEVYRITSDQLARFCCRFWFSRLLLARSKAKKVVVLDSDGKVAEVAAAKSLGLPVTEVQHGMFSTREPDYSWQKFHREISFGLPLPDAQVVFGDVWADQLLDAGYWSEESIFVAKNPLLNEYRTLRSRKREFRDTTKSYLLQVLFPTQGYVRDAAIRFWTNVFECENKTGQNLFQLKIKIHPLERDHKNEYQTLANRYSDKVCVVSEDNEAFDAMLSADVVVGYTSLMMVEAIGMGLSVIGLEGHASGAGIAETFRMPELSKYVLPCTDEYEFFEIVQQLSRELKSELRGGSSAAFSDEGEIYSVDGPAVEELVV